MMPVRRFSVACLSALVVSAGSLSATPGLAAEPTQSGAKPAAMSGGPGSLDGIWLNAKYLGSSSHTERERVLHTVDGKLPPLLPWASELLEKRIKESEGGAPFANTL